jgi:hypothetical protein
MAARQQARRQRAQPKQAKDPEALDCGQNTPLPFPAKVVSCKLVENKGENRNPPTSRNGQKP